MQDTYIQLKNQTKYYLIPIQFNDCSHHMLCSAVCDASIWNNLFCIYLNFIFFFVEFIFIITQIDVCKRTRQHLDLCRYICGCRCSPLLRSIWIAYIRVLLVIYWMSFGWLFECGKLATKWNWPKIEKANIVYWKCIWYG